jgi:hypothetical protein
MRQINIQYELQNALTSLIKQKLNSNIIGTLNIDSNVSADHQSLDVLQKNYRRHMCPHI